MIKLENIHFSIEAKKILKGISVAFEPGMIHGIIGPNGSGKSTLLKNICRIWEPESGVVLISNMDYRSLSRKELSKLITLVPQNTNISFPITVYDIVSMGRNPHLGRFEGLKKKDREIIEKALRETDTYELKDRNSNELSGGECQLSVIARALATEASAILLDEPTSDLDIKHTLAIMELLGSIKNKNKTILLCVHDLNLARRYCDTITIINNGLIYYHGHPSEAFSKENIITVFGVDVDEIRSEYGCFLNFYSYKTKETTADDN